MSLANNFRSRVRSVAVSHWWQVAISVVKHMPTVKSLCFTGSLRWHALRNPLDGAHCIS